MGVVMGVLVGVAVGVVVDAVANLVAVVSLIIVEDGVVVDVVKESLFSGKIVEHGFVFSKLVNLSLEVDSIAFDIFDVDLFVSIIFNFDKLAFEDFLFFSLCGFILVAEFDNLE